MPIRYKSTRGKQTGLSFEEVVLGGLATDKGLYIPESVPTFSKEKIESVRLILLHLDFLSLSFQDENFTHHRCEE